MLFSTHVSNLIKSKSSNKHQLTTLPPDATIRSALEIFMEQDISVIPISADPTTDTFIGNLSVTDILKYILKGALESFYKQSVQALLSRSIQTVIDECGIRRVKMISEHLSLMHLLLRHWGQLIAQDHEDDIDEKHLLVKCEHGKYEIVTPTDLLRYILLISHESELLRCTKAITIPNSFTIDESRIASGEEDAWKTFCRLLDTRPFYLMGIIDQDTGELSSNLSAIDFLPSSQSISLDEAISMLRRPGLSIYAFVQAIKPIALQKNLDPILLQPHFSLADLIEKMAKMKIHQLWRVSQDRKRCPIGTVGIGDVIGFLSRILQQYFDEPFLDQ